MQHDFFQGEWLLTAVPFQVPLPGLAAAVCSAYNRLGSIRASVSLGTLLREHFKAFFKQLLKKFSGAAT